MPLFLVTSLIAFVLQSVAPHANIRLPHLTEVVAIVMGEDER